MTHILGVFGLGTTELIILLFIFIAPIVTLILVLSLRKNKTVIVQNFQQPILDKKYFLTENGIQVGPFDISELKNRRITPETPVWMNGLTDWVQAKQLPELQGLFSAGGPPPFKGRV